MPVFKPHTQARARALISQDSLFIHVLRWVAGFVIVPGVCGPHKPQGARALTSFPKVLYIANIWCLFSLVNNDSSKVN